MRPNKLVSNVELAQQIEPGLKIIQFATEHSLHRSYLRNCPLTDKSAPNKRDPRSKNDSEKADIIA